MNKEKNEKCRSMNALTFEVPSFLYLHFIACWWVQYRRGVGCIEVVVLVLVLVVVVVVGGGL